MSYSLVYVASRFLFRVVDFFHHWYINASRFFLHRLVSLLERLDYTFAVHVTLRHFAEPLYGDYSLVGRILGVIFRSGRILIGSSIYLLIGLGFLLAYVAWLLFPMIILFFIIRHSFDRAVVLPY